MITGIVGMTWLALGGNVAGPWGPPAATLTRACREIGIWARATPMISPLITSVPLQGGGRQPTFVNAVMGLRTTQPAGILLRQLKTLERQAGRRLGRHWGPRPLDIDILTCGTQRYGWPHRQRGGVTLPHPEMHRRGFVLGPLLRLTPHWQHPALRVAGTRLRTRVNRPRRKTKV